MKPKINKPARVTRKTAAAIGHTLIMCFANNFFQNS